MAAQKIQKRNGAIVDFDSAKIEKAIFAAAKAAGGKDLNEAKKLVEQVVVELEKEDKVPTVEEVQDLVEKILIKAGHPTTAKTYILYREKRATQRADRDVVVEVEKTIGEYLNQLDWRVNANSNQGYSLGGMILNTAGKVTANYWLSPHLSEKCRRRAPEWRLPHSRSRHVLRLLRRVVAARTFGRRFQRIARQN